MATISGLVWSVETDLCRALGGLLALVWGQGCPINTGMNPK